MPFQDPVEPLKDVFELLICPPSLVVDFAAFYPTSVRPTFTYTIADFYISNYRDRFFILPPLWFKGFVFLEFLYHLPLSLWTIPALLRSMCDLDTGCTLLMPKGDPMVPLQLLVFAIETAVTTLTCTLEMLSWEGYSSEEQARLSALYVPYLGLGECLPCQRDLNSKLT